MMSRDSYLKGHAGRAGRGGAAVTAPCRKPNLPMAAAHFDAQKRGKERLRKCATCGFFQWQSTIDACSIAVAVVRVRDRVFE